MQKRFECSLPFPIWPFGFVIGTKITAVCEVKTCPHILAEFIQAVKHFSSGLSDILIYIPILLRNFHEYPFFNALQSES